MPGRNAKGIAMTRILWIALMGATVAGTALPRKPAVSRQANAAVLLALMDTNRNGKISKQEWMEFMEAEFDKVDADKTGDLDRKELLDSRVSVTHSRSWDLHK